MKICIVGKFPPIEGGVSMLNYRYAHALALQGHQVHVVTNAGEVKVPYRMFMRDEDWAHCDGDYGAGSVRVHWTDPYDREQWHIPTSNPFVTKLSSIGARVCEEHDIDVVFSFYMEPYGVAGHLIAQMAGLPHVVKTAGSDAGRLWKHRQFEPLYDHIFKSAAYVVAGGTVSKGLNAIGIPSNRIRPDGEFRVPDGLFSPDGPELDIGLLSRQVAESPTHARLQWGVVRDDLAYVGVYGKLGQSKGTAALLQAISRLVETGQKVGLLVMGHEPPKSTFRFRDTVSELGLGDHVVQLPFLPHWRVPEFIRRCVAVCCLEQDFPIAIHTPVMAREVLCCGAPLIASTEMIEKLPQNQRLVDGYNCFAVTDVNDIDELSAKVGNVLDPSCDTMAIGQRAREYVIDVQAPLRFPGRIERTLSLAVSGAGDHIARRVGVAQHRRFALTHLVADRTKVGGVVGIAPEPGNMSEELFWAEAVLGELTRQVDAGASSLASLRDAVSFDICLAKAVAARDPGSTTETAADRLFRLKLSDGAAFPTDIRSLIPWRLPTVVAHRFDHDVNAFLRASAEQALPDAVPARTSYAVFLADGNGRGIRTVVLDEDAGRLLEACNGTMSVRDLCENGGPERVAEPADEERIVETTRRFFEIGLIGLRDEIPAAAVA